MAEIDFSKSELELIKDFVKYPNDFKYPVGTILTCYEDIDPATKYGGEWEKIEDRFLLGAGETFSADSVGGEAEHTLTKGEMPQHQHAIKYTKTSTGYTYGMLNQPNAAGTNALDPNGYVYTMNEGENQPHNNMPPYIAMYMWIKTKSEKELKESV